MAIAATMVWEVQSGGSDTLCSGGFAGGALVSTPSAPSVAVSAGGSIANATYYIVITYNDVYGETSASPETSAVSSGSNHTFTVTAPSISNNIVSWNVYVGTTSGGPYWPQGTLLALGTDRVITATPPVTGTQASGTDYSQSTSAHVTIDGATITAVVAATTTNLTLTGYTASAADVGNTVNITGGTATAGVYQIIGFSGTNTWILDRSVGTAAQTATGIMGGAFATPGKVGSVHTACNGVWLKQAAYTMSTTNNVAGGRLTLIAGSSGGNGRPTSVWGYNTSRGDFGTKPILQPSATATTLITFNASCKVDNIEFQANGQTSSAGVTAPNAAYYIRRCKFNGVAQGVNMAGNCGLVEDCLFTACTGSGTTAPLYSNAGAGHRIIGCSFLANTGNTNGNININTVPGCVVERCIVAGHTGTSAGIYIQGSTSFVLIHNCSIDQRSAGNSANSAGIMIGAASYLCVVVENTIITSPPALAVSFDAYTSNLAQNRGSLLRNCASWKNNGLADNNGFPTEGFITLTADPFTNASGNDYSLNNTAGGGNACRAVGIPSTWLGLSTTGYLDTGAVQHQDPPSSSLILQGIPIY